MKKIGIGIVGLIIILSLISGCVTTTTNTQTNAALGADELDARLREASDYLNTRIPKGNKVAFINISGGYPDLAEYILGDLSRHGVNDGVFSVVDRAQLEAVRSELNFNMSGEVSDQSAQAIGQMLGAQTIVSGSIRRVGNLYRLEVKAIEVQTASVQGQQIWNIPHGATIAALTTNTGGGTAVTAAPAGGRTQPAAAGGTATPAAATPAAATPAASVQAAQPTRPRNGTYTFVPRPRAYKGAAQINAYIYQIIVRNEYMNVYVSSSQFGRHSRAGSEIFNDGGDRRFVVLKDLDTGKSYYPEQGIRPTHSWDDSNEWFTFKGVTARRFSLSILYGSPTIIWEEVIIPNEPD